MKFLPIAERELRVAARKPKTYRNRWIAALIALIAGGWMLTGLMRLGGGGLSGMQALFFIGQPALVVCIFGGLAQTCDSLSEEKREGTLGLLFLTDLRASDIVLGKLLANSLSSIYGLLATFPLFFLIVLVGGVRGMEVFKLAIALLNALFLALSAGLFASSICRRQRSASNIGTGLMLLIWIGLPALGEWLRFKSIAIGAADWVSLISPARTILFISGTGLSKGYGWSLLATHLLAWSFLGLACWILPRSWREKVPGVARAGWRRRFQEWRAGIGGMPGAVRRALLDRNAFLWLASRDRTRTAVTWLMLVGGGGMVAGLWWYARPDFESLAAMVIASVLFHSVLKLDFAATAARQLADERHSGTVELILSTPLTVGEILRGQWLALIRQFLVPVVVVICLDFAMLGLLRFTENEVFMEMSAKHLSGTGLTALAVGGVNLVFLADLAALGWAAMWSGLNTRIPAHAPTYAVLPVLVVPWLVLLGAISGISILQPEWMNGFQFWHFVTAWCGLGLVADVTAVLWCRPALYRRFRIVATQRFQPGARAAWRLFGRR
jgi:ABC-type transport system involved in multi-copper enzyme maturation permease subunit